MIFFGVAAFIMFISAFVHVQFQKNPFVRFYLGGRVSKNLEAFASPRNYLGRPESFEGTGIPDPRAQSSLFDIHKINQTLDRSNNEELEIDKKKRRKSSGFDIEEDFVLSENKGPKQTGMVAFFTLLKRSLRVASPYLTSIFVVLFVTFIIFPGVLEKREFFFLKGI